MSESKILNTVSRCALNVLTFSAEAIHTEQEVTMSAGNSIHLINNTPLTAADNMHAACTCQCGYLHDYLFSVSSRLHIREVPLNKDRVKEDVIKNLRRYLQRAQSASTICHPLEGDKYILNVC